MTVESSPADVPLVTDARARGPIVALNGRLRAALFAGLVASALAGPSVFAASACGTAHAPPLVAAPAAGGETQ